MPSSRGYSPPRDQTSVFYISSLSCTAGGFFTTEPPGKPKEPRDVMLNKPNDYSFSSLWHGPYTFNNSITTGEGLQRETHRMLWKLIIGNLSFFFYKIFFRLCRVLDAVCGLFWHRGWLQSPQAQELPYSMWGPSCPELLHWKADS